MLIIIKTIKKQRKYIKYTKKKIKIVTDYKNFIHFKKVKIINRYQIR